MHTWIVDLDGMACEILKQRGFVVQNICGTRAQVFPKEEREDDAFLLFSFMLLAQTKTCVTASEDTTTYTGCSLERSDRSRVALHPLWMFT